MTPTQHTAPEAMVEACAKAIHEGRSPIPWDVTVNQDIAFRDARAAIAAISGQIREECFRAGFKAAARYDWNYGANGHEQMIEDRDTAAFLALIEGANHEPR